MREFLKFGLGCLVFFAVFAAIWISLENRKKLQRRLWIGGTALIGLILLTMGLRRHLAGDDSLRGGGKYGPQAWYQDIGAGCVLIVAAVAGCLTKPSKDEEPNQPPEPTAPSGRGSS
jgi:hypothetical protein